MKDIYDILHAVSTRPNDQYFALATLVRSHGSSYRRPGARFLVCADGSTVGSISAGCLEDEVAARAAEVLVTGVPLHLAFDTRRRFGCNGSIEVLLERVDADFFHKIAAQLRSRETCSLVSSETGTIVGNTRDGFLHEIAPPVRFILFGDGPDGAPLRKLGRALGWEVLETTETNELPVSHDGRTVAVLKSHNYGRDFAALSRLLPLHLPYLGLMGPRQRRDQLLNDLLDAGFTIDAGFFAPAGLDLGAETPEEIALSIISEIQRVLARRSGESLRERKNLPIHASVPSSPVVR